MKDDAANTPGIHRNACGKYDPPAIYSTVNVPRHLLSHPTLRRLDDATA